MKIYYQNRNLSLIITNNLPDKHIKLSYNNIYKKMKFD